MYVCYGLVGRCWKMLEVPAFRSSQPEMISLRLEALGDLSLSPKPRLTARFPLTRATPPSAISTLPPQRSMRARSFGLSGLWSVVSPGAPPRNMPHLRLPEMYPLAFPKTCFARETCKHLQSCFGDSVKPPLEHHEEIYQCNK